MKYYAFDVAVASIRAMIQHDMFLLHHKKYDNTWGMASFVLYCFVVSKLLLFLILGFLSYSCEYEIKLLQSIRENDWRFFYEKMVGKDPVKYCSSESL